jgi:tyrosyl-tRNA synthetase
MSNERKAIIDDLLTRSVDQIIDKVHLETRLLNKEPLRIKFGIDPTSPNVHIGRAVPLLKLKKFQSLGCKIILIIGDFTGVIGDTSDKNAERPMLSREVVKENLKTYIDQFKKIVDIDSVEVHYNSEWLGKLHYWELCEQADQFSLNEFNSRTNIKKRLDSGSRVSLRELMYPMMQGYDSVMVKADVELGGSDQWFNLLAGRTLQKHYKQAPQDILTNTLIEGLDGRKMSSSWGNTINLNDEPKEMYGKVMTLADSLMIKYFEACTEMPLKEVATLEDQLKTGKVSPRDLKALLAFEITKLYWQEKGAKEGQDYFESVIRNKEVPTDMPFFNVAGLSIVDALIASGLAESKSDARRTIDGRGVRIDGEVVIDYEGKLTSGSVIQKGKRHFVRVK